MKKIAILGAGIAGLSAGYYLKRAGVYYEIFEKQNTYGGLASSFLWHGFYCDFAAHRFFTNDNEVESTLLDLVPMVHHTRRSKLYLKGKWVNDPINPVELLQFIPLKEKIQLVLELMIHKKDIETDNFQDYVINKHGNYMFQVFFKPYTEKLFGIKANDISVLWAKNKVRLNNPFKYIDNRSKKYFSYFYYPIDRGYGAIADTFFNKLSDHVQLNTTVNSIIKDNGQIIGVEYEKNGQKSTYYCDAIISTLPLTLTAQLLNLEFKQKYQKVDAVYLLINRPQVSENHWVYFTDEDFSINRLVEFKNLSPVNRPHDTTVLCAEVTKTENNVIEKVIDDLVNVGMITRDEILDTKIVRQDFGYPVYSVNYEKDLANVMERINTFTNFYVLGRSAEFIHREVDDILVSSSQLTDNILKELAVEPVVIPAPEEKMRNTCIIILTYNNLKDTLECIASLRQLTGGPYKVFVVDNGSSDKTPETIANIYPDIDVLPLTENVGVPSGFNHGIYKALSENFEYLFIMNNDTVVDPYMMDQLLKVAKNDHNCGIVMPKIFFYPPHTGKVSRDKVWADGGYYRKFPPAIKLKDDRNGIDFENPRKVEFAPTCALLIHRRAFQTVGLLDPGYFFFFEDWDYSERVRKAGLNIWCAPQAKLWHKVSSSTRKDQSTYWHMMGESGMRFFRRHNGPISATIQITYFIFRDFFFKTKNFKYLKYYLRGLRDGYFRSLDAYPDISNLMVSEIVDNHSEKSNDF